MTTRKEENLKALGRDTGYLTTYAPEVLETFENKHPENDYWVQFNCPEFTSLCPITGQPDFAEIKIMYLPAERMVESKSLKLYPSSSMPWIRARLVERSEMMFPVYFGSQLTLIFMIGSRMIGLHLS